jgi:hypothetical protein
MPGPNHPAVNRSLLDILFTLGSEQFGWERKGCSRDAEETN